MKIMGIGNKTINGFKGNFLQGGRIMYKILVFKWRLSEVNGTNAKQVIHHFKPIKSEVKGYAFYNYKETNDHFELGNYNYAEQKDLQDFIDSIYERVCLCRNDPWENVVIEFMSTTWINTGNGHFCEPFSKKEQEEFYRLYLKT